MSSRSIEGENPLYLPQAKVYDGSCALGPVIALSVASTGIVPPDDFTLPSGDVGHINIEGISDLKNSGA